MYIQISVMYTYCHCHCYDYALSVNLNCSLEHRIEWRMKRKHNKLYYIYPYTYMHAYTYVLATTYMGDIYVFMHIYLGRNYIQSTLSFLHLYFPVTRSIQALFTRFKCLYNDLLGLGTGLDEMYFHSSLLTYTICVHILTFN